MSTPSLVVDVRTSASGVVVALAGELDVHHAERAHEALATAAADGASAIVLDLRDLDFVDSSGLKLVLVWHRRLQERDVAFSVVRGPAHVQRPFASAGVEDLLPFVDRPPA